MTRVKLIQDLQNRYREPLILLRQLVITDFKLRYKGSALGYVWSVLKPLLMFLVLYVIFAVVIDTSGDVSNFPIYLLLGVVLWSFFSEMTQQSLSSIVGRGDLIRKIRVPRWLIVVSASISASINLFLNLIVVLVFAIIYGMHFSWTCILLPLYVVEIYILALGLSFVLASYYVKYRDVSYIWEVIIQAGFYATPILYSISIIKNELVQKIMILNPMAQAIQGARNVFVTPDALTIGDIWGLSFMVMVPLMIVVLLFIYGAYYFRKESKYFAENL